MKISTSKSLIGSAIAFFLATACCWLPVALVSLGGAATLVTFSEGLGQYTFVFAAIGLLLLSAGIYQFIQKMNVDSKEKEVILTSVITCPNCNYQCNENMPTNACQYFYKCQNCRTVLKPLKGDCCVYCSYGSVPCPPIQQDKACC